jgi:hypothetical protein
LSYPGQCILFSKASGIRWDPPWSNFRDREGRRAMGNKDGKVLLHPWKEQMFEDMGKTRTGRSHFCLALAW